MNLTRYYALLLSILFFTLAFVNLFPVYRSTAYTVGTVLMLVAGLYAIVTRLQGKW